MVLMKVFRVLEVEVVAVMMMMTVIVMAMWMMVIFGRGSDGIVEGDGGIWWK